MKKKLIQLVMCGMVLLFTNCHKQQENVPSNFAPNHSVDSTASTIDVVSPVGIVIGDLILDFRVGDQTELDTVWVEYDGSIKMLKTEFENNNPALFDTILFFGQPTSDFDTITIYAVDKLRHKTVLKRPFRAINSDQINSLLASTNFSMTFEQTIIDSISMVTATPVYGNPTYSASPNNIPNTAYTPSTDSGYLIFNNIQSTLFNSGADMPVSITFNFYTPKEAGGSDPYRCGLLTFSDSIGDNGNQLNEGIKIFCDGDAANSQYLLKANFSGTWIDFGTRLEPETWYFITYVLDGGEVTMYLNGVKQGAVAGVTLDWTGVKYLSIASGEPTFTDWAHYSIGTGGRMTNIRMFSSPLTGEQVFMLQAWNNQ